MIMRLKESSGGSVGKDVPGIIHCSGGRDKTTQQLWYLVL